MADENNKIRTRKGLKDYTYLGCPLTKNKSAWCFRLCAPDAKGCGRCGRIAPHSMKSKIQLGIEHQKKLKKLQTHFEKLERMYLAAPCNKDSELGIRVLEGTAEIVVPVQETDRCPSGAVQNAMIYKIMDDAAALAINALVHKNLVQTQNFNISFIHPVTEGQLTAKGRLLNVSGDQYYTEAVLTDAEGMEIARGIGIYVKSDTLLSPDRGYA